MEAVRHLQNPAGPPRTAGMFQSAEVPASRRPLRLLIPPTPPVEAVRTFVCKISASFRRQTAFARTKYHEKIHQLEAKFLNSSEGDAGLIFAVPNIPANIVPAELASALNDTLARFCNDSQTIHSSYTSLTPDSSNEKDLLDFEHEEHPSTPSYPSTTSNSDLLLPELSGSCMAVESSFSSQVSTDDLLLLLRRHGLHELLQAPLVPATREDLTQQMHQRPPVREPALPDVFAFLKTLTFQDLSPYPLVPQVEPPVKRARAKPLGSIVVTENKKALLRKQSTSNLRRACRNSPRKHAAVPERAAHPQCLRPSQPNIHRDRVPGPVQYPTPARTYMQPQEVPSAYTALQFGGTSLLPEAPTTTHKLMEEMTAELDRVWAAFENMKKEHDAPEEATAESDRPDSRRVPAHPVVPLRLSSRAVITASQQARLRPISFKARLLDASRSAILFAAAEAGTSELRWFHCGT